ncbi:conserved hypothetical protein [Formosa agariphila KMM 3901]|uniref:Uncharacterized protein n=1 Tax=Formosa agariphila (strain DSM 15362 / KCTC 12365 / LMG 23005 / KMM 3901 / M-2Alg 35-1) TaxID=1347342 RepID=T2KL45_FORAG|nr:hypothetical protein [Formosa agariphila]CDF79163.1 conserved hypothetical protein [Formosa agariphila KMM 3901]
MRTDNGKVKNIIVSVYFVLILLAVIMATVFSAFSDLTNNAGIIFFIIVFVFAGLFLAVYLIAKYFEYDSDGDKVFVTNKGLLLSERFNYRAHEFEFNKEDLVGFKFNNYIVYRSLVLYVKSKGRSTVKEHFNISLVTRRKRKYVRQSLSKMVKNNTSKKV